MNEIGFPTQTVGADSIRLNVAGVSHSANGSSMKSAPLGFPRGEAGMANNRHFGTDYLS